MQNQQYSGASPTGKCVVLASHRCAERFGWSPSSGIGVPTCLAREVLSSVIPIRVAPPESLVDPLTECTAAGGETRAFYIGSHRKCGRNRALPMLGRRSWPPHPPSSLPPLIVLSTDTDSCTSPSSSPFKCLPQSGSLCINEVH